MNQILEYDTNRKNPGTNGSDKIVKIFAIVLVVFAVILICIVLKERKDNSENEGKSGKTEVQADISVEIDEENSKATISVTCATTIEKIVYSWENGKENVIKVNDKTAKESIDVPTGENVLHIKVIDVDGVETTYTKETDVEQGIDIESPVINIEVTKDAKLKIKATDETELNFITYRWNDEAETKIIAEGDDKKIIETEIEIMKGENDITIIAVDTSNNTTTQRKSFTGRTKPSIKVELAQDGKSVGINISDEYGIDTIKLNFNGQDYDVNLESENSPIAAFNLDLETGNNRIIIEVTNIYGISSKFDGEIPYGSNQNEQEDDSDDENSESEENQDNNEENDEENNDDNGENQEE